MKIALSSEGRDLDSQIDPRFGRARYFILVEIESSSSNAEEGSSPETAGSHNAEEDTNNLAFDVVENVQNLNALQGAGVQAAQIVVDHGAGVVLTGNCGPKAFRVLSAAGVQVMVNVTGSVKEAVQGYLAGKFQTVDAPNVEGHWI